MSAPDNNFLTQFLNVILEMLNDVRDALVDEEARAAALAELGLDPATELPDPSFSAPDAVPHNPSHDDWLTTVAGLVKFADELYEFLKRVQTDPTEAVADELFALLTLDYFRLRRPLVYYLAEAGAFLLDSSELERIPATVPQGIESVGRHFGQFLKNPIDKVEAVGSAIKNLPIETESDARRAADVIFTALALLPAIAGTKWIQTMYGWDPPPDSTTPRGDRLAERAFAFRFAIGSGDTVLMPAFAWQFVPAEHTGGPGMLLSFGGTFDQTWQIGESWDARLQVKSPGQLDVLIQPGWSAELFAEGATEASQAEAVFSLVRRPDKLAPPAVGLNDGVRIEFGDPSVTFRMSARGASLSVRAARTALTIEGAADPVTERTLPQGGWRGHTDLELALLPEVAFKGSGGLELHVPFTEGAGAIEVPYLLIGIRRKEGQQGLALEFAAAMTVRLGAITLTLDRVGIGLDFASWRDVDAGFQPPRGIGIAVDTEAVKGGGYLLFDSDKDQYAGVVDLQLRSGTQITGIGVLTTSPEFSLLVMLFAHNLGTVGVGFSLTGIGGLIGLDRTVNFQELKTGLENKTLDRIMFPPDPIANAPAIVSTAAIVFPPLKGHLIVGLLAQLTWGLGRLLTLELGIILEVQAARFTILGKLRLLVPSPEASLIRIQVDLVGQIDLPRQQVFILARLVDSKLARYDLKGSAALFLKWGDHGTFIVSFGGFNPRYQLEDGVPEEFSRLERLSVSLAREKHLELTLTGYVAFTPNTLQVGGSIFAYVSAGKFSVEGFLAADALIDRTTATFFVDIEARLQLKAWGTNLFMVKFKGTLEGPLLRFKGKATFSIWIFDYSVPVNVPLGGFPPPIAVERTNVRQQLVAALQNPQSWSAELPSGAESVAILATRSGGTAIVLHPLGTLAVHQAVVPLGIEITRFGRSRPEGEARFDITAVSVAGRDADRSPLVEHFARSEFFDLTEDEAYAAPSFERMPAGVRVGSSQVTSGTRETITLGYRTLVYDAEKDELETVDPYQLPDGHLMTLLAISASARLLAVYTGPARPVHVAKLGYVVASVADFKVAPEAQIASEGVTFTHAMQVLRRLDERKAGSQDELTVAPAEVTAA